MHEEFTIPSDIAFTPAVKAIQTRKGSRRAYAHMEANGGWNTTITPDLALFIAAQTSVFLGTANAAGQPYIQHRGGPPGFLRVIDPQTLAFADFSGNQQYVSVGHMAANPKAFLFLMDYERRQRVKIYGTAHVSNDPGLLRATAVDGYDADVERVIVFDVGGWTANCPQHIPQR